MADGGGGPYAIYRTEKIKTLRSLGGSSKHMNRSQPTPNADPSIPNRVIVGSADPAADVKKILPGTKDRGEDGVLLRRKNSVLAIEVMLTASPEWWQTSTEEQRQDWLKQSCRWLADEYGRENIAHLQLHQDETSPHLTGFIVPRDPDTGRLNARRWIGGNAETEAKLEKQQTSYAQRVKHLGLMRGIKGSKAQHQRVKRHYAQINRPVKPIRIEPPTWRDLFNPKGYAERQTKAATKAAAPMAARARTADSDRTTAEAARTTAKYLSKKNERLDQELTEARKVADEMRALPLDEVLEALGFQRDAKDKAKWKAEGYAITVTGSKFYDHHAQKGGGGSIDLAKHVMETDFKGALAWLADAFGPGAAQADLTDRLRSQASGQIKAAQKEREPFSAPPPVVSNWKDVRRYLVDERGLPADTVDAMHHRGDVYADKRRNAVFLTRDDRGKVVGAELKGTAGAFTGLAPGSNKTEGGFRLGRLAAKTVYLVESAIDAVSLYVMRRREGEESIAVVSTAGAAYSAPLGVTRGMADGAERVCAYDADEQGDTSARSLAGAGWRRLRPSRGKDWNDELRAAAGDDEGAPAPDHGRGPAPDDEGPSGPGAPRL